MQPQLHREHYHDEHRDKKASHQKKILWAGIIEPTSCWKENHIKSFLIANKQDQTGKLVEMNSFTQQIMQQGMSQLLNLTKVPFHFY